ncbi:MAG: hypothetical protein ACI4C7_03000, partial [Clostridia bacterium]
MREASFDFGKKPVIDGYTKVTEHTLYTDKLGYGIEKQAAAEEREIGEKELYRDFLLMPENTFKVKLENGTYTVRVATGDYVDEGDVTTAYEVNGVRSGVWVHDGTVVENVFDVDVTDGIMEFKFAQGRHCAVNAIDIAEKKIIKMS